MKIICTVLLAMSVWGLSACNTIEGLGKDIKASGEAIERTADQNRK